MEDTVNQLEAMIQKADSDLNYLERKLDFEFGKDGGGEAQVNPQQLVQKVGQVKKDYVAIVKEVQGIQQSQQETMDFFRGELATACQMLQKLQSQTGQEGSDPPNLEEIEAMLGMKLPSSVSGNSQASTSGAVTHAEQQGETTDTAPKAAADVSGGSGCQSQISPSARQTGCKECIDLTQDEFETVSSLVRGRVKLSDVNHTYQRLWQHFKEEGNSDDLGTQEMYKMGLKVTGATGEAKLKVLKALKLIMMDRKGGVNLV